MASENGKRPTKPRKKSDPAVSYDQLKEFEGRKYTGMKVGRSHKWYYDQGEWKEKKVTPDLWQISYAVTKRRAGKAPEGSGVPVGTEYHWYIAAHQNVTKINANDYTTSLAGLKFKVAHRRADTGRWSASEAGQRRRMTKFLRSLIEDLEQEPEADVPAEVKAATTRKPRKANARKKRAARTTRSKATEEGSARKEAVRPRRTEPATPASMKKPTRRRRKVKPES
jgi:hypothetical protein